MSREELIKAILEMKPLPIKKESLEDLEYKELYVIYYANKGLSYYDGLKKQQMISTITNFYEDKYSNVELVSKSYEEIEKMFLRAIKKTPEQFEKYVNSTVEAFKLRAQMEGNDEYVAFSKDEQIIASCVLVLTPDMVFTRENKKQSKKTQNEEQENFDLFAVFDAAEQKRLAAINRVAEIDARIEELNQEIADNEALMETCRSSETHEYMNENFAARMAISRLTDEKRTLMDLYPDDFPRTRR